MNSYTLGHTEDLSSDNDGGVHLVNVYDPDYNRGPADYDVKHTFVSNFVYALPLGKNHKLGGWEVSGIVYARSGRALILSGPVEELLCNGTGPGATRFDRAHRGRNR